MELVRTPDGFSLPGKVLSDLDRFTLAFTDVLNKEQVTYAIVGGYVAILFGRSRSSEDVDLFLAPISRERFLTLWDKLHDAGFECIITDNAASAFDDYLTQETAIRFAYAGEQMPNMEVKFPKLPLDDWAIENRQEMLLDGHRFWFAPNELGIPYKLLMGSDKDIEDARHLYLVLREHLDLDLLRSFARKLQIGERMRFLR